MIRQIYQCALCTAFFIILLSALTACGGEISEKTLVLGEEAQKNIQEEIKYPGANDRMVYIPQEEPVLQQWSREGKKQKTIALPVEKYGGIDEEYSLLWVTGDEILWSVYAEGDSKYKTIILSTPIRQTASGEEIMLTQTKELFTINEEDDLDIGGLGDSMEEPGIIYADDKRLQFISGGDLYEYDRTAKKGPVCLENPEGKKYSWGVVSAMIQGKSMIYHTGRTPGKVEQNAYGFWRYDLEKKERKQIDDRCYTNAAYVTDPEGSKVWYQITEDQSIWEYDCVTEDKKELISEKVFKKCYEENQLSWDDGYYDDLLFMEGEQIYFIKNKQDPMIFSYSFQDRTLSFKKELTDAVRRSGYADSEEAELNMVKDKLLLYLSDEDMKVCYLSIDLKTAGIKEAGSDDPEIIYFGMLGKWYADDARRSWKEKENNNTADAYKAETVEEQLALIGRQSGVWLETDDDTEGMGYYYTITDLDHNGRLEVIVSSGFQGSGGFTSSKYYQISQDGTRVRRVYAGEGSGEDDIVDCIQTAYVDTKTDTYYYCTYDYVSGGAGARYVGYGAMVLKKGLITTRVYASGESMWDKKKEEEVWQYSFYQDGKEKKLKGNQCDPDVLANKFFKGLKKKKVKISWFYLNSGRNPTEKKVKKLVEKSYQGFQVG